ncbi:MAG: ABC transporter ATP-binding protein [Chitinophagaceae bacterium]|nr:MAG: ABC transporter ATP-binding protein [Chitinophagaceae bacterium]
MALLEARNIHKRFGTLEVLKGVDLNVLPREIVSIVGPSGSGKSTLLHILGTLDTADSGTVTLGDTRVTGLSGRRLAELRNKRVGFVFQFHHLLPEFSALENVCIPAWIQGRKGSAVNDEATRLLGLLGLGHRLGHKPAQLSGGEQQRVAVARALVNRPDIVFADEPTGNLDSANARELHDLFFRLRQELGQTFLIVTHNEDLARLSDRVVSMKDGKVIS